MNIFSKLSLVAGFAGKYTQLMVNVCVTLSNAAFQAKKSFLVLQEALDQGRLAKQLTQAKMGISKILSGVADLVESITSAYEEVKTSPVHRDIRMAFRPSLLALASLKNIIEPLVEEIKTFEGDFKTLNSLDKVSWLAQDASFRRLVSLGYVQVTKEQFETWKDAKGEAASSHLDNNLDTLGYARYLDFSGDVEPVKCIYWVE